MPKGIRFSCAMLLLFGLSDGAAYSQTSKGPETVLVEGVADARSQPPLFAKRAAWLDAMRTLGEQVLGVDFSLEVRKEGSIRYAMNGEVAPSGTVQQVSAETLPTGIFLIKLKVQVDLDAVGGQGLPRTDSLPEIIGEGKGDIAASRNLAAARAAAKATAMAEAVREAAADEYVKAHKPIPRTLEGHAYYLGSIAERIEGNFYFMKARFKVRLTM